MNETDEARLSRYVEALPDERSASTYEDAARSVIAIADEEQAALRAEVERLRTEMRQHLDGGQLLLDRAQDASKRLLAEVERLTRECLDREATETDARERLRQVEERLADAQGRLGAVEALWDMWRKRLHSKHADGNEGEDCVHCMADDIHEAMWGERD